MTKLVSDRLLEKLDKFNICYDGWFDYSNMSDKGRWYLDIATDGESVSYIPTNRLDKFDGDFWNEEIRRKMAMKTKPGRVLQYMAGKELSYETQRKIRSMLFNADDFEVRIMTGDDVAVAYNEDNYDEDRGTIGNSCMRYCPSSFFELYKKYACIATVVRKSNDKICARSVMFHNCYSLACDFSLTVLSKIYSVDDLFEDMLMGWALEQGYYVMKSGRGCNYMAHKDDNEIRVDDIKPIFELDEYVNHELNYLPYIDNFVCTVLDCDGTPYLSPSEDYFPDYIEYIENCCYRGGYAVMERHDYKNYCEDCTFKCSECWKSANTGDWEEYDYEMSQEWCDEHCCTECCYWDEGWGECTR